MSEIFEYELIDDFEIIDLGIKNQYVYDMSVGGNHNFFANNILVHNSTFFSIKSLFLNFFHEDVWNELTDDDKVALTKKISRIVEDHVNKESYEQTQVNEYNSQVDDFKISFKQEIIAKSGIFVNKKKYAAHIIDNEGVKIDDISATGLELIRSDTPSSCKEFLKETMKVILQNNNDDDVVKKINECKNILLTKKPEHIAANIGIGNINKYKTDQCEIKSGATHQAKGAINYEKILKFLGLTNDYEPIEEKKKAKVVYLLKNKWGFESLSFPGHWPVEFDKHFLIDYDKMIDIYYTKKIELILNPINKQHLTNLDEMGLENFLF